MVGAGLSRSIEAGSRTRAVDVSEDLPLFSLFDAVRDLRQSTVVVVSIVYGEIVPGGGETEGDMENGIVLGLSGEYAESSLRMSYPHFLSYSHHSTGVRSVLPLSFTRTLH